YEDDVASTQSINPTKEDSDKEDLEEEHLFEDLEEELHKTDKKHEESGFLDSDEIDALEHEFLIDDKDDNADPQTNELNLPDYSNLYDSFKESILQLYFDSYGRKPLTVKSAISELNTKYSLKHFDDLVDFNELFERRKAGHSVDEDLLKRTIPSVKEFVE